MKGRSDFAKYIRKKRIEEIMVTQISGDYKYHCIHSIYLLSEIVFFNHKHTIIMGRIIK